MSKKNKIKCNECYSTHLTQEGTEKKPSGLKKVYVCNECDNIQIDKDTVNTNICNFRADDAEDCCSKKPNIDHGGWQDRDGEENCIDYISFINSIEILKKLRNGD